MAKQIDGYIKQFTKVAEAQEAADKLEAGLAKAEGLDRAKLLDKLIDAKQKLAPVRSRGRREHPEVDQGNHRPGRRQQGRPEEEVPVQGGPGRRRSSSAGGQDRRSQRRPGQGPGDARHFRRRGAAGPVPQGPNRLACTHEHGAKGIACLKKALEAAPRRRNGPHDQDVLAQLGAGKTGEAGAAKKESNDELKSGRCDKCESGQM